MSHRIVQEITLRLQFTSDHPLTRDDLYTWLNHVKGLAIREVCFLGPVQVIGYVIPGYALGTFSPPTGASSQASPDAGANGATGSAAPAISLEGFSD